MSYEYTIAAPRPLEVRDGGGVFAPVVQINNGVGPHSDAAREETLYADGLGVRVTTTRAIFDNGLRTYSIANITSMRIRTHRATSLLASAAFWFWAKLAAVTFALALLLNAVKHNSSEAVGILSLIGLAIGVVRYFQLAPRNRVFYTIELGTAGGESEAMIGLNREYVAKIAHALNEAMIRSGLR